MNFVKIIVALALLANIGLSASLEPAENTNSDAKNNKIEDNLDTITNEYLQLLFSDRELTNEFLVLKRNADKEAEEKNATKNQVENKNVNNSIIIDIKEKK